MARHKTFYYVVHHELKFMYFRIPKVASTTILKWYFELRGIKYKEEHDYINYNRDQCCPNHEAIENPSYYIFGFIRNPWRRLVSSYIQKIVGMEEWRRKEQELGKEVIYEIQKSKGEEPNLLKGVTFKEFVLFLCNLSTTKMNNHWIPQHIFLQNEKLDFLGIMENLEEEFEFIQKKIGTKIKLGRKNTIDYSSPSGKCVAETSSTELRDGYPYFPHYKDFYNLELIEMVESVYRGDIELYNTIQKKKLSDRRFPLE